jgi:UDP-N-acetyl-D-mannosaminuronic acid dehydrogenase
VNDYMPDHTAEQIVATSRRFRDPRIACLGLSFKANVGDLRESPAVDITARIAAALPDVKVLAVEPHVTSLPGQLDGLDNVVLTDAEHAITESDVIALLVDHSCFRAIKKTQLAGKVVYDTRGMWG